MAKKKIKKTPSVKKEKSENYQTRTPEKTLRSKGCFYSHKREKADGSISWRVVFESWRDGKPKKEIVPKSMYPDLGVKSEMSHAQVKQALKEYNKIRKKEIKVDHSQIKALKRFEEMKSYSKTFFPPAYVEEGSSPKVGAAGFLLATIRLHSDSIISKVMHSVGSVLYLIHPSM